MRLPWSRWTIWFSVTRQWREHNDWNTPIPHRFGWAIYDFNTDVRYYALIPLNLFWAAGWWLWNRVRWIWPNRLISDLEGRVAKREYDRGYDDGFRNGQNWEKTSVPSSNR